MTPNRVGKYCDIEVQWQPPDRLDWCDKGDYSDFDCDETLVFPFYSASAPSVATVGALTLQDVSMGIAALTGGIPNSRVLLLSNNTYGVRGNTFASGDDHNVKKKK